MAPFEIIPGWRIGTQDRQFTLEYLQASRGKRKPSWRPVGYYGRIEHAVEAYASEAVRQGGQPLPVALAEVQDQIERLMAQLRGAELKGGQTGEPA